MAKKSKTIRKSAPKHAAKRVSKASRKKAAGSMSLANLSTEALAAELKRRRSELPKLEKRAAALRAELASVLARMASLGGVSGSTADSAPETAASAPRRAKKAPAAGRGRRTINGQPTIGEQIVEILGASGSVLSPREIGGALGKRLSREVNTSFLVQISLTLARLVKQGRVSKVGRGQYSAASGAPVATND